MSMLLNNSLDIRSQGIILTTKNNLVFAASAFRFLNARLLLWHIQSVTERFFNIIKFMPSTN